MEVLAIAGGVASIASLIEISARTGSILIKLVEEIRDVPEELRRHRLTVRSICNRLERMQSRYEASQTDFNFPASSWQELWTSLQELQKDVETVAKITRLYYTGERKIISMRARIQYRLKDQPAVLNATKHLELSERNLDRFERDFHMYNMP